MNFIALVGTESSGLEGEGVCGFALRRFAGVQVGEVGVIPYGTAGTVPAFGFDMAQLRAVDAQGALVEGVVRGDSHLTFKEEKLSLSISSMVSANDRTFH